MKKRYEGRMKKKDMRGWGFYFTAFADREGVFTTVMVFFW